MNRRVVLVCAIVTILGLAVLAMVMARMGVRHGASSDLNLLVVTLDTTRADRMGAYGATGNGTPAFDRIAAQGVLFQHAVTAAPLTLPAHATIFTGRYPPRHGVRDNGGFFLNEAELTLAERLKASGFKTGGFVGAYVLDRRWGIAQGFDTYVDGFEQSPTAGTKTAEVERPGNEVADRALEWLEGVAGDRFFGWVHLFDAHSPYDPPEPYRSRFAAEPYAGEIAFADAQLARLLAFLERRGLLNKTVIVVIGDHGESLGEHGESTHGFFAYQSVLEVPFAILAPPERRIPARRVADVVRSVDVAPTVLDLLNLPAADTFDGTSLVPLMNGAVRELNLEAYSEAMYPRYHFGWSELRALTAGRFKYIDAPRPELYDLERDPQETRNLYAARQPLADRMSNALRAIGDTSAATTSPRIEGDADARERLAALGYVGTFSTNLSRAPSLLADPKDKVEMFNLMTRAREALQAAGGSSSGLEMLQEVTRKDPEVIDAWLLMGNEYAKRRELDRALVSFRRALQVNPDYDLAVMNVANVYRDLGRPSDALVGLKRFVDAHPENVHARQQMAQILLDTDRLADAERELMTVLRQDPLMAAARNSLGALRLKQGDASAGEREIRAALTRQADLPFAHFNLALAAEQRGDLDTARVEYQTEVRLNPGNYMAYFNLGKLHEKSGDRPAQLEAWQQAVLSNPGFAEGHLFLAKLYLDLHRLDDAIRSAKRGLDQQASGEWTPLGHFVLSDAYAAQGRSAEAAAEQALGRRLAEKKR